MTGWLACDSRKIPAVSWDQHHQTSFLLENIVVLSIKDKISAIVHVNISLSTNKQHRTDLLQIAGPLNSAATGSYVQYDSSWIECIRWLSLMLFWLVTIYILLRTSHFFLFSSYSPFYNIKWWLHKHLNQVQLGFNRAEWQALHPLCLQLSHSSNTHTSYSTVMLQLLLLEIWPRTHI